MSGEIDDLLPTAREIQIQISIHEAEKAERHLRCVTAAETERHALIESLSKRSELSEQEKITLASTVIQRAVHNGLSEIQLYCFPNALCIDRGRAINLQEPGWEKTLTGIPLEIFRLWFDYLKPRGYRISYQIVEFAGGTSGDISISIGWGD
jgi:hypothetical protein